MSSSCVFTHQLELVKPITSVVVTSHKTYKDERASKMFKFLRTSRPFFSTPLSKARFSTFNFEPLFQLSEPKNPVSFRKINSEGVRVVRGPNGLDFLQIDPEVLTRVSSEAFTDINFHFRSSHLRLLRKVFDDPESSANDRFVAYELLRNAVISSARILPSCQDTGTAIAIGWRGERILTGSSDDASVSQGAFEAYRDHNFRYSQVAPLSMFKEKNTGTNLPCQVDIFLNNKNPLEYKFLFVAKGGGSANKTQLFQRTKALLREDELEKFLTEQVAALGTAACPPYHLAVVIGGLSAEQTLKTVKLLSCKYYDDLPTTGDEFGRAFRDLEWERKLLGIGEKLGIGAQFGGKYFLHDARVLRLPRHGASLPIGLGVSCSADRQALAKITPEGVFLEQLETDPAQYLPHDLPAEDTMYTARLDIDELGMDGLRRELSKLPVKTRITLTGSLIVARDIAHARLADMLKAGKSLPEYFKQYPVYYAGPAKKPGDHPAGSFGPTTAGRMDPYLNDFMKAGGSFVSIGKGNRSPQAVAACRANGGFYLGSIGGAAAAVAESFIKKVEVVDFPELGMEAVWKIKVKEFPCFVVIDDKGGDFFKDLGQEILRGRA